MRPYGQKKAYGKYITKTWRKSSSSKIQVKTGVKNRKAGRRVPPEDLELTAVDQS